LTREVRCNEKQQGLSSTMNDSGKLSSPTTASPISPREPFDETSPKVSPRRGFPSGTLSVPRYVNVKNYINLKRSPRNINPPPVSSPTDKILSPMSNLLKHKRPSVGSIKEKGDQPVRESPRYRDNMISPRNFSLIQSATNDNVVQVVDNESDDEDDSYRSSNSSDEDTDDEVDN
jgi:hypothetical protein